MEQQKNIQQPSVNDDIDLLELAKVIWAERRFVLKVTGLFALFGLIIAFTSKIEYEASCKLMPESMEGIQSGLGSLGGLAGLAGINVNIGSEGTLTPLLYPELVRSVPFQLDLMHHPILFSETRTEMTSYQYFKDVDRPSLLGLIIEYSFGLPGKIKDFFVKHESERQFGNEEFIYLAKEDWKLLEDFRERMSVSVNDKTGVILITTEMPDPYAASKITGLIVTKLTQEVTEYKIGKVRINLEFIEGRYNEAKKEYEQKQAQLAIFADRNKNISSSLFQTEYQRIQNELNIAFEVYKGLATQLEQAKIKVKEETPVFTVLEPVQIPMEKSKPKRVIILFGFIFIGSIVGTGIILFRHGVR